MKLFGASLQILVEGDGDKEGGCVE